MKQKTTLPLLFLLLLITAKSLAQQTGYLHLRIYGSKNPVCLLDTTHLKTSDTLLSLAPGIHKVQIWKSKMALIDSSIRINSGDTAKYSFVLKYTNEYLFYKRAYNEYLDKRNKRLFVSPIIMGLAIGTGMMLNSQVTQNQYELMKDARFNYLRVSTQTKMNEQKTAFEAYHKKYQRLKKIEYGLYSVAGLVAINYVRIVIKQRRTPVPEYKEEKLLSKIDFNLYPDFERKALLCGFSMKF